MQVKGIILLLHDDLSFAIMMIVVSVIDVVIMVEPVVAQEPPVMTAPVMMVKTVMVAQSLRVVLEVVLLCDDPAVMAKPAMAASKSAVPATTETAPEAATMFEVLRTLKYRCRIGGKITHRSGVSLTAWCNIYCCYCGTTKYCCRRGGNYKQSLVHDTSSRVGFSLTSR
jgi:hypothetical protein